MKKLLTLLAFSILFIVSCSNDDDSTMDPGGEIPMPPEEIPDEGGADFSTYVALGDFSTAGFSDAALFIDGQEASFPNMLAGSFAEVGGGDFTTPFMADNLGGLNVAGNQVYPNRLILDFSSGSPAPVPVSGTPTTEATNVLSGTFNNMGVPGARSYHLLLEGYGNAAALELNLANPYYVRFASNPVASILGDALAQNPTFFSLWIGVNDVLEYALCGGCGMDQTNNPDPRTYGFGDISDPNVVAGAVDAILDQLTTAGAEGVVANIPDLVDLPVFTALPFAPLDPTNPAFGPLIPALNEQFSQLNQVFEFLGVPERSIVFKTDAASALVISDESLTDLSAEITATLIGSGVDVPTATILGLTYGQARQANENDRILLGSSLGGVTTDIIAAQNEEYFAFLRSQGVPAETAAQLSINGITYPLEDQWVLIPAEQTAIRTATSAYNASIQGLVQRYDLPLADMNALFTQIITEGIPLSDGSMVTGEYAVGGGFSLDGGNLTPRGSALAANAFIEAIEEKYEAMLTKIDPLDYTGVYIN
jgi:hypothetical protein